MKITLHQIPGGKDKFSSLEFSSLSRALNYAYNYKVTGCITIEEQERFEVIHLKDGKRPTGSLHHGKPEWVAANIGCALDLEVTTTGESKL